MSRFVKPLKGFKNIYRHLSTLSCCVTFCLLWYIKNRLRHCCLIPNILHNIFFYFPQRKESHIRVSKVEFLFESCVNLGVELQYCSCKKKYLAKKMYMISALWKAAWKGLHAAVIIIQLLAYLIQSANADVILTCRK